MVPDLLPFGIFWPEIRRASGFKLRLGLRRKMLRGSISCRVLEGADPGRVGYLESRVAQIK